jgi:hypothetical protein
MWEPQPLTTLTASKACRGENFTYCRQGVGWTVIIKEISLLQPPSQAKMNKSNNTSLFWHRNSENYIIGVSEVIHNLFGIKE